jgi:hypothetical protein
MSKFSSPVMQCELLHSWCHSLASALLTPHGGFVLTRGPRVRRSALICMNNAPDIPKKNFHALTRLDENRAKCQVKHLLLIHAMRLTTDPFLACLNRNFSSSPLLAKIFPLSVRVEAPIFLGRHGSSIFGSLDSLISPANLFSSTVYIFVQSSWPFHPISSWLN